jgi:fused signal recognition particle receptor
MLKFFKKLVTPFSKIFSKKIDESSFNELEKLFFEADLGVATSGELVETLRAAARLNVDPGSFLSLVKEELLKVFEAKPTPTLASPHVILIVGVNGSGKTTTIAKLARHYRNMGKSVLIAAGDTFRAASVEQLEAWSKKVGAALIKSKPNGDPSAVAFDALAKALAKAIDIVLIDTAGRLETKTDLMQELSKIRRTCQKQLQGAPHETLLILDACVGQNALDAARIFHEFTPITGIVLTKLDGSSKGGIAVAIQKELKIPIQWVGHGETEDDLIPFNAAEYVDALLGIQ